MTKILYPFKLKDYFTLIGLIIIGFGWLLTDQFFLSEVYQRFIALFLVFLGLFYIQFLINKPLSIIRYANTLAVICLIFIILMSIVMHIVINHDFTFKSVLIWIISGIVPYVAGFLYSKTRKTE